MYDNIMMSVCHNGSVVICVCVCASMALFCQLLCRVGVTKLLSPLRLARPGGSLGNLHAYPNFRCTSVVFKTNLIHQCLGYLPYLPNGKNIYKHL